MTEIRSEEAVSVFPRRCFEPDRITLSRQVQSSMIEPLQVTENGPGVDDANRNEAKEMDIAMWLRSMEWLSAMDADYILRKMQENFVELVSDLDFAVHSTEELARAPFGVPSAERLWAELRLLDSPS